MKTTGIIMSLLCISVLLAVPVAFATTTCFDSDNGLNYYTKGNTTLIKTGTTQITTKTDVCSRNTLTEYYCSLALNKIQSKTYKCPYGCANGACLNPPTTTTTSTTTSVPTTVLTTTTIPATTTTIPTTTTSTTVPTTTTTSTTTTVPTTTTSTTTITTTTVPTTTVETTIPTTTTTIETTTTIPEQTHFSSPVTTNSWMNIYGNININGLPAQPGDEIAAFDPQNVLCGVFRIVSNGVYGFLHIYGDDTTTAADEGAVSGDNITFKVYDISENREISTTQTVSWSAFGSQQFDITV